MLSLGVAAAAIAPSVHAAEEEHDAEFEQAMADAIAQARADGYNRGREVEMARQESLQGGLTDG
jgi:flagellar biosynthesis/type III secretory pathway protein FliH